MKDNRSSRQPQFDRTQALVDEIIERCEGHKRERVSALWSTLRAMRTKGTTNFTIAAVGRECERAGFLKTQSIRNATGADYLEIIRTFQSEIDDTGESSPQRPGKLSPIESYINSIGDIQIRVRLIEIIETSRRQAAEIVRLKNGYKHVMAEDRQDVAKLKKSRPGPRTGRSEWAPLERFISSDWLDTRRLEIREGEAIFSEELGRITPDGFVTSLTKALSRLNIEC